MDQPSKSEIEVGCQVMVRSTKEKGTVEKRNFSNYLVNFGNKKAWRANKELVIIPGIQYVILPLHYSLSTSQSVNIKWLQIVTFLFQLILFFPIA
jgi:hypothetical protein